MERKWEIEKTIVGGGGGGNQFKQRYWAPLQTDREADLIMLFKKAPPTPEGTCLLRAQVICEKRGYIGSTNRVITKTKQHTQKKDPRNVSTAKRKP